MRDLQSHPSAPTDDYMREIHSQRVQVKTPLRHSPWYYFYQALELKILKLKSKNVMKTGMPVGKQIAVRASDGS